MQKNGKQVGAREALFQEEPTLADEARKQLELQKARNLAEFAEDDPEARVLYEG